MAEETGPKPASKLAEASEIVAKATDAIYALTRTMDRGQVLSHDEVQVVLGVPPHAHPWDLVMRKVARRLLRERSIALWPNYVGGYKLCTVAEQLQLPTERLRRAGRQARKGRIAVEAIPDRALSTAQRHARAFLVARNRETELRIQMDTLAIATQLRQSERLPRRPAAPIDPRTPTPNQGG